MTIYFTKLIIYPKILNHEYVKNKELDAQAFDEGYLQSFETKVVHIPSIFGYSLSGEVILQENKNSPFLLICHGITSNYEGSKKYAQLFLKLGYSVMIYDHRNHGYNKAMHTSLGYFEKYDAKACIDYIFHVFNTDKVGIMGESMGAAVAMQLAAIDDRLMFCIEDCGFSNAYTLVKYRAKLDHNFFVAQWTFFSNIYLKLFYKWQLKDVSIIHNIQAIKCPILFIHGVEDAYVPFEMVHDLYEAFDKEKELFVVKEAKHAMALKTDPKGYYKAVKNFLDKYNL
jgi:hypothetical protein